MAKKKTLYDLREVSDMALSFLKEKHFGGLTPSDFNSNWTWQGITDRERGNVYGIWLRYGLQTFCVSFAYDIGLYPVFENGNDNCLGYKHWEDLTEDERRELKVCGFLSKR